MSFELNHEEVLYYLFNLILRIDSIFFVFSIIQSIIQASPYMPYTNMYCVYTQTPYIPKYIHPNP